MDALTKQGVFPQMQDYLLNGQIRYHGLIKTKNGVENVITMREIQIKENFTENDLMNIQA